MDPDYLAQTFGLATRSALITGSCSGLGLAIARALGRTGATVYINGRHADRCATVARDLASCGIDARPAPFDVANEPSVIEAFRRFDEQGIAFDVLVTCAGNQDRKPVTDMTLSQWRALMAVHVEGAFLCVRAVLPGMIARRHGRIILMSSVAGQAAMPNIDAYASAKGAIAAFARAVAVEYGGHGITANAIAPGFTRTGFTQALQQNDAFGKFLEAAVPAGRWAEPEEIAPAVVFLASTAGRFVNGHTLAIDGGLLAHL